MKDMEKYLHEIIEIRDSKIEGLELELNYKDQAISHEKSELGKLNDRLVCIRILFLVLKDSNLSTETAIVVIKQEDKIFRIEFPKAVYALTSDFVVAGWDKNIDNMNGWDFLTKIHRKQFTLASKT